MSILAYCVALSTEGATAPAAGVGGAPVLSIQAYGLDCWYNQVDEQSFSGDEQIKKAALEFHRFISSIFIGATVLPFRFPTILESVNELRDHLDEKAHWYASALGQTEGLAQFEARLISKVLAPVAAESGTAYLEEKKQAINGLRVAQEAVVEKLEDFIQQSHVKEAPGGMRMYFLSEKRRWAEMRAILNGLALPSGFELRFSGPWPATEFLPSEEDL